MRTTLNIRRALPGILAVTAVALAMFATSAAGDDLNFKLSGDMEVPPVTTTASGDGTVTVMSDMSISGKLMTSGVKATMAHIHIGKAGTNGPVIITLTRNGDNGWTIPSGSKLSAAEYKAYQAGELYANVHSAEHKGGEIRGQLTPSMAPKTTY